MSLRPRRRPPALAHSPAVVAPNAPNVAVDGGRRFWPAVRRPPSSVQAASLLLSVMVGVVVWPWLSPALAWDHLPDGPNHLVRVFVLDASLRSGDLYPRWVPDLYLGYGYPLFNFYAPGTYYLAGALHRSGLSIYASLQWVGVLAAALGATGAYALVRRVAASNGGLVPSLLAAACFVAAPYPFLTNLYVRGAVPEALALGLLPWLLVAGEGCWRRGGAWSAALAGCAAALVLVHNLTSLIGLALLGVWVVVRNVLVAQPRFDNLRATRRVLAAATVGCGLAAWFWLPAAAETRHVQIGLAQGGLYDFRHWLFDPGAATGPLGGPDYPHTRLGPADLAPAFDYSAIGKGLPEKPSLAQLLVWCFAAAAPLAGFGGHGWSSARPAALGAWTWAAAAALFWFLNTTWSLALWEHVPALALVQFPWRFYGPLSLCLAVGLGSALAAVPPGRQAGGTARVVALAAVLLLAYGALVNRPAPLGPLPAHDVDERNLSALETDRYGAGTTSGGEFLPQTVGWPEYSDGNKAGLRLYDRLYPEAGWQAGLVRVLSGSATLAGIGQQPRRITADVDAQDATWLGFHQLMFPGWRAFVDGAAAPITPAAAPLVDPQSGMLAGTASLGFITVPVPSGRHHVEVHLGATRSNFLADALAAGALVAAGLWLVARWSRAAAVLAPRWHHRGAPLWAYGVVWCAGAALMIWWGYAQSGPSETLPPSASRLALDLTGALAPHGPAQFIAIGSQSRRALVVPVPSQMEATARLPAHAFLQVGLAPHPADLRSPLPGMRFVAEVDGAFGHRTVLDRTIDGADWSGSPSWIDAWVDLESLAGQQVVIRVRVEPAGDPGGATQALWANPQVVRWTSLARPYPGTQHLW